MQNHTEQPQAGYDYQKEEWKEEETCRKDTAGDPEEANAAMWIRTVAVIEFDMKSNHCYEIMIYDCLVAALRYLCICIPPPVTISSSRSISWGRQPSHGWWWSVAKKSHFHAFEM